LLVRGSGFSDDREEEAIVGDEFARKHGLQPGDRVSLILNAKLESFIIVGTAISPEYVYMVRGVGDVLPDPQHFGILYIKEDYAGGARLHGRRQPGRGEFVATAEASSTESGETAPASRS